jgi:hypothetical protein
MSSWRSKLTWPVLAIAIALLLLVSWRFHVRARASLQAAQDGLMESERLINEIARNRNAPRIASLEAEPPDQIAARVAAAADQSQLAPSAIVSIDPQLPVRMDTSAYNLRVTQIALQDTTLPQLVAFAAGLEDASTGTVVRDLNLTRSDTRSENASELWNVRLTLTQMIFSPISGR